MTAPVSVFPARRFAVLVGYVFRACIPPRRLAVLALPCAAIAASGLLARTTGQASSVAFTEVAGIAIFGLALPLGALVIGDAVLGAEIRAGTFTFTWLTPTPVLEIASARWLGGCLVAWATLVPSAALAAVLAGAPGAVGPVLAGTAAGAAAHIASFVAIGALTRRNAVWSLGLLFLVERLLGAALSSVAQLSPTWLGRELFVGLHDQLERFGRSGVPDGLDALARLGTIGAACLALATVGLARLRLSGSRD